MTTIVAAVQYTPVLRDVHKNIAQAQQLAFEAASKGAKIVVLPELCMSGFVLQNVREASECAQELDGYQTQALLPIAKQNDCYIVFGFVQLKEGKLYNAAAVLGPQGVVGAAQKHNLWGSDNLWAQPSEAMSPVIVTPYGRMGVLICRDAMNKYRESYVFKKPNQRFYQPGSVDVIALLTNWSGDYGYPDSSWVELVEDTRANLIVSNRVGKERDLSFKGGSAIITRNRVIWTNGSNFTSEAVVGGVIE